MDRKALIVALVDLPPQAGDGWQVDVKSIGRAVDGVEASVLVQVTDENRVPLIPPTNGYGEQEGAPVRDWGNARWPSSADIAARLGRALGIDPDRVHLDAMSWDSCELPGEAIVSVRVDVR